ncbi:hypothetical protein EYC59_04555 [Candidatus Saccharibacteria bacterium]|nr:MAG: hypothetical protein EYC59_04555 [Candidatus Saccharibacteria bacterium]
MLANVILVVSVLISVFTGVFVYARNPKHIVNKLFASLALLLTLFSLANYLSLSASNKLFYIRSVMLLATLSVATLYYLIFFLHNETKKLSSMQRFGIGYSLFVAGLCFTPLVFTGLSSGPNPSPIPNVGAVLFFVQLVTFLANSFTLLIKRIKSSRGVQRQQYASILVGITPMFLLSPITGFVLPVVYQNTSLIFLSPVYAAFFVSLIGYTIIKHHLFDIRFFVVRSVAYIATLAVLAAGFGLIVFGSLHFFIDVDVGLGAQIYISVATALAALVFSSLKSFFDRISNNLFYRDAYDSQTLLDDLNNLFVKHTDLERLLKQSATVLEQSMKVQFCLFGMRKTAQAPERLIGSRLTNLGVEDIEAIEKALAGSQRKLIITDELDSNHEALQALLRSQGIALLCHLSPGMTQKTASFGYLIMGARRSGNAFTTKDTRILEVIANQLVIAIESSMRFEQIQHFNETLQVSVNEATRKLRKTNEKLQGLDATKDEFITMASHQLRTPLTAVKGYLSMVLEGDAGKLNANQRRLLEQSYTSAQRMVYLIADLLNLSRLGTGKFVIESTPTNLIDVVQTEMDQLEQTAASREVHLTFEHPEVLTEIMLDETKIHQVVMNFIDNAIYYTPPGGRVVVSLTETPGSVVYAVHDTGIGVPRREQRHLFTKFYRAENARQARPDGTGLGLFMAKKVVAAQGGAIIFESEEGKGSTFGFRFNKRTHQVPSAKEQA